VRGPNHYDVLKQTEHTAATKRAFDEASAEIAPNAADPEPHRPEHSQEPATPAATPQSLQQEPGIVYDDWDARREAKIERIDAEVRNERNPTHEFRDRLNRFDNDELVRDRAEAELASRRDEPTPSAEATAEAEREDRTGRGGEMTDAQRAHLDRLHDSAYRDRGNEHARPRDGGHGRGGRGKGDV